MCNEINAVKSVHSEVTEPIWCYVLLNTKYYSQTHHLSMCYPMFRFDEDITWQKKKNSTYAIYVTGELNSVNCVRSFFLNFCPIMPDDCSLNGNM
jgi:hypothetical protein